MISHDDLTWFEMATSPLVTVAGQAAVFDAELGLNHANLHWTNADSDTTHSFHKSGA